MLCNDAFKCVTLTYTQSNSKITVTDASEAVWKDSVVACLKYYPSINLGTMQTTKDLNQDTCPPQ
jgi:hypothetical protein